MPNYISRSNIDFATYADTYGSLADSNRNGNIHTKNIRRTAQGSWWSQHKTLKDPLLNDCQLTIKFLLTGLGVNKILTFDD